MCRHPMALNGHQGPWCMRARHLVSATVSGPNGCVNVLAQPLCVCGVWMGESHRAQGAGRGGGGGGVTLWQNHVTRIASASSTLR